MRVLPAIRVKGRIAREVSGVRKSWRPLFAGGATAGRQLACTFGTYDLSGAWNERIDFRNLERTFLQWRRGFKPPAGPLGQPWSYRWRPRMAVDI